MLSFRIALRYLFSRTRLHAVNYVTALSAVAIAVVAMALVAVVGVYNGYVAMILGATKQVDADIVLRDTEGGVFDLKKFPDYRTKLTKAGAEAIALRLESKGLLRVGSSSGSWMPSVWTRPLPPSTRWGVQLMCPSSTRRRPS